MDLPTPPPDELWWERELLRNEKQLDDYLGALNQHSDMGPWLDGSSLDEDEQALFASAADEDFPDVEQGFDETDNPAEQVDFEQHPQDSGGYPEIARQAREFAIQAFELSDLPQDAEVFYLSAGKVSANLAGGHGIGYDEDTICGNIVKCRWARADCEFCREMLEHMLRRRYRDDLAATLASCERLSTAILDRIEGLRTRVWW